MKVHKVQTHRAVQTKFLHFIVAVKSRWPISSFPHFYFVYTILQIRLWKCSDGVVFIVFFLLCYIQNEDTSSPADKMADESEDVDLKLPRLRKSSISVMEDLPNEDIKRNPLYFTNRNLKKAATEKVSSV